MCGIAGLLNFNRLEQQGSYHSILESMLEAIKHRGPDDSGLFKSDFGVLGHRRLSIIDVEHGHQPMCSNDGRYVLVFNGEIYNYIELRVELIQEGVSFDTFSDTEVLLKLLIEKGESAISRLNGMFAFCFLDTLTGEWLMARDHFGIKPLYLANAADGLYFASEIKALLQAPGVDASVNGVGLSHYFTFQFCLGSETLFSGVTKVEPGTYIKGKGAEYQQPVKYWDIDYSVDDTHTEAYFLERLDVLLKDSARLQVRSDVPLGAYLSGGLDSSAISVLASNTLKKGLPLFTGKFAEGPAYDESHYARMVSDSVSGIMHEIVPTAQDFADSISDIIYGLDEPLAGPGVFPQYMVSKAASEHVKVILGGQGGDEIFGGYARYLVGYLEQALKHSIFGASDEGSSAIELANIIPNLGLLEQYKPMMSNLWREGLFEEKEKRYFRLIDRSPDTSSMLTGDMLQSFDKERVYNDYLKVFNGIDSPSYINKMTHFDLKTLLPALLHVEDRVSMMASIESRVPLLDPRITELMATVPPSMKFQGGKTKAVLKTAVSPILPHDVVNRKDKMGFPVPLNDWMKKGPVKDFVMDTLLSQRSLERGVYKREVLNNLGNYSGVGARQLWGVLSLELWYQNYIDTPAGLKKVANI